MDGQEQDSRQWHLDKRVPIALILAMAGQVAVVAWASAVMFKDIEANRNGIHSLNSRVSTIDSAANQQAIQLGRIEESISGVRTDINRLLTMIERERRPFQGGRP